LGSGLRGNSASRIAAWYTKDAITTDACMSSSFCSLSKTSRLVWWVTVEYSVSSWMNWKPGSPTRSKD
jgi:hypothetical protein